MAVALAARGCRVTALYPRSGHPLRKTRAVSQHFEYSVLNPLKSLERAISRVDPYLVIPCDDRSVQHLHELHDRACTRTDDHATAQLIERSLGPCSSFAITRSRYALWEIASEEGVPMPEMRSVHSLYDLMAWHERHNGPSVIKLDGSWGGHGVRIGNSSADTHRLFKRMNRPASFVSVIKRWLVNRDAYWFRDWWHGDRPEITIQQYVEGRPGNCTVWCWQGAVKGCITVEVVESQTATGPATIVRVTDNADMAEAATKVASRLKLSGFYGFDFMIEAFSNTPYLIELNPRCTLPCHLDLGVGRDLIGALCSQICQETMPSVPLMPNRDIIAYFPQAWHSHPDSPALTHGYHDVPWSEPELVKEALRIPWPNRSPLARISDWIRGSTFEQRQKRRSVFFSTISRECSRLEIVSESESDLVVR